MSHSRRFALGALAGTLALAGCQDLAVTNPNVPDRDRATRQPLSVESFVASSFRTWWPSVHDDYPVWALSTMADEPDFEPLRSDPLFQTLTSAVS